MLLLSLPYLFIGDEPMSKPEENIFYVYVYLDPRKPGDYVYGDYHFDYEPFYIGKGNGDRAYIHLNENKYNHHFHNKIKKIQRITGQDPIVSLYREQLLEDTAFELEIYMVETIGRWDLKLGPLCNLTDAGKGCCGHICSDETKRKLSIINKGKIVSEEIRKKISECAKGRKYSEKTKQKMSESQKGKSKSEETKKKMSYYAKNRSNEHKRKIRIANTGKKHSDEIKEKIRIASTGKIVSEETREKLRIANTGKKRSDKARQKLSESHKGKTYIKRKIN
jgi:hypothetical protein